MPYLRLSVTICVSAVALLACGDGGPKQLREATKADLQQLLLAEDDVGGSYSVVRDGIEGVVEPCLSDDQICQVVLKPNTAPGNSTICAYAEVQWSRSVEAAKYGFERVRDAYTEAAQDPEVGIEVLHPSGFVDGALATHRKIATRCALQPASLLTITTTE